jgi:lipopolysaccharide transport system ATP-binding protein
VWIDAGRIRAEGEHVDVIRSYNKATQVEPDNMRRFSAV